VGSLCLRSLRLAFVAAWLAVAGLGALAAPALAQSVDFGTPTATSTFLKGIDFEQPYSGGGFTEADVVITYPGAIGPSIVAIESPGSRSLSYELDTSSGELQPNTTLTAHFRVAFSDGTEQAGPEISVTYVDTRFQWKTKTSGVVRLHWYSGSDSFASQALDIAVQGVSKAAQFMGVSEAKPIDFFVYASQQPFYDALGPGTRENVGGQANTTTRTLFALIGPGDMSYAETVVPHELTHVVFDEVTTNAYHYPPRWLNEGVAVYVSQGFDSADRSMVRQAASNSTLMPLAAIGGQFPTSQDRFYLAYAESVSAIDYFIRTYGQPALEKLLQAYGTGASDDEAFQAATGADAAAFDRAWQNSTGVKALASYGPQPAPTGPLPPGWGPTGASGAAAVMATPTAMASPGGSSGGRGGSTDGSLIVIAIVAVVVLAVAVVAAVVFLRRRAARPTDAL
jgi:hypothetical protein